MRLNVLKTIRRVLLMENNELIKNALKYIDKLGANKTTIEDVAKNAGFSVDYFNRIFRSHTGFNVMEYVRFRKLNRAARMLRSFPDKDIIDVALESGYDSHEGFTRAFKEQYGKTPSEYREQMKDKPMVWADFGYNATVSAEFRHILPAFYEKDADEIIDILLEKDAFRYGYTASSIAINGSKILCDSELEAIGGYVSADIAVGGKPYLGLILNDTAALRENVEKLLPLAPQNINLCFGCDVTLKEIERTLKGIKCKEITERDEAMYFGESFILPEESKEYDIHFLEMSDLVALEEFISRFDDEVFVKSGAYGVKRSLKQSVSERANRSAGVFKDGKLLAISYDCLQPVHGFKINNCIQSTRLPEADDKAIEYLYMFATNSVIERGYIPFEDSQFGDYAKTHGNFSAYDLGFRKVNTRYSIIF